MNQKIIYPNMSLVKQKLFSSEILEVSRAVEESISKVMASANIPIKKGQKVAVAVGSRGINQIDSVLYYCLRYLKSIGLNPFIVPAMGSHGGATSIGQINVLSKLGITEEKMEAPIVSDMDVVSLGELLQGVNVFFSRTAMEADYIVAINRIKLHTKFRADIESGICKILSIGLGKEAGATEFHNSAVKHSFKIIEDAARLILSKVNLLFGLSILEDGYGKLSKIEAISKDFLIEREKILLKESASTIGRIPFDNLDVLIIDFIGKDISGIGMDSNVTGRHRDIVGDFYESPHVKRIFVRDLSPRSDGNGNGIGLADITTKRLVEKLDLEKTYTNSIAAISPEKAAIPMYFDTDKKCIDICAATIGKSSLKEARIVRIKNTSSLYCMQVSEALKEEVISNPSLSQISDWIPMGFGEDGNFSFNF
ncbi:MAG: DUF2088 domain-containing protein [Desulfobacterales bacterium]|nr:DUF2088 domain-containing protein [Desulfobacterales bacterium]MBF0395518.1 DUF2088 domain-containing protein [Desulfobacterales bacterium]